MRKIRKDRLDALFAAICATHTLYLPQDGRGGAAYARYEKGATLSDARNTGRSAKDFFFPQTENLMDFRTAGKRVEVVDTREECEDFVLFGVRACDVRSFAVLDRVFLSDPVDTYYQNRRAHGVIFSLACNRPAPTCFCGTFDIDAADPEGDVACWEWQGTLYLTEKTEKGARMLAALESVTEKAAPEETEEAVAGIRQRLAALPLAGLKKDAFGPGKTEKFFNAPQWQELSGACLGCGSCTFVCPTCQCYDIQDFKTKDGVRRFRCWDSCMYSDFTQMSAGQPRLTQMERFRQRFMHKLVYYPTNNDGMFSCVGCGRCMEKCPIQMNIVKVMKTLGGERNG